jgi:glycosyltransferase involved in cell wall biosynthesis
MNNIVKPFFSIIVPTYNHAHFIGRCIESLLSQTYQNWEVIIVNNFSEDNTVEIVEGYNDPRIRLINNANEGIIAVSRNKGLDEAKGDWICFLDSDDWWYSNKLENALQYLPHFDMIYHNLDIYKNNVKSQGVAKSRQLVGDMAKDLIINGNGVVNSSVILRKSIANLVGKITTERALIAVEDYDYWIRVANKTNRFKYISKSLGGYWVGENMSYSIKQIDREKALLEKYSSELNPKEKKAAISRQQFENSRLYHSLALYSQAKKNYLKSLSTNNLGRKLKSLLGYVMCVLKINK